MTINDLIALPAVIVQWYAPSCEWCHDFWPKLISWADKHQIKVVKVDIKTPDGDKLAEKYGVERVPLTMILVKGVEVVRSNALSASDLDRIWVLAETELKKRGIGV